MLTDFLLFIIAVLLIVLIITVSTMISDTRDYLAKFINEVVVTIKDSK